jgi:hypothetical protein
MPYRITNRSTGPILLRLRSGRTVHLRAGAETSDLEGSEVNGSPRIASLVERRLIAVQEVTPAGTGRRPRTAAKSAGPAGKSAAPIGKSAAPAGKRAGSSRTHATSAGAKDETT